MSGSLLRVLPARRIVTLVADAAARWRNADYPPRVRATAAIETRMGYSTPVVEYALDRLFGGITDDALTATIAAELGTVAALDGVVARPGAPDAWARGVERAAIVSSDTTIGVAVVPAIFALCAKCDVVVKDRSDALVAAFFSSLAEEHPAFATAAEARQWAGGDDASEDLLLARADVVVAFGGDDALRAIRGRCGVETRFVPFGHRASIGRLTAAAAERLDDAEADAIARDALLYDGEGCMSLHALFVEGSPDAVERTAARLAAAFERIGLELPPGIVAPERAAAVAAYRELARFRAANGGGTMLRGGAATIVSAPADEPPPFLPRVLPLIAIDSDDDVARYVAAQRLPVQALGITTTDDRDVVLAARIGAVRVARFGTLQDPPVTGHHGGAPRISDFVRWIDLA